MSTLQRAAAALAVLFLLAPAAAAQDDGITPEIAALRAELADYGAAGDLALIAEALRIRVLADEMDPPQAAAEFASRQAALTGAAPDAQRRADAVAEHRHAMEHLFAVIERAIRTSPQWPADRSAEEYAIFAGVQLEMLRDDYNAAMREGRDPTPIAISAETLLALTDGVADLPLAHSAIVSTVTLGLPEATGRTASVGSTAGGTETSTRGAATGGRTTGTGTTTTTGSGTTTTMASSPVEAGSLAWVDKSRDEVGPWGQGTPDGQPDGHFTLLLRLPQATEIASIAVYSADANGAAAGGQVWHSANTVHFVLGVHNLGFRLNSKHVPSLGVHKGDVSFDLYCADSGWFNNGQNFLVEVTFPDGSKWTQTAAVGAAASTSTGTTTTTETLPSATTAYAPEYRDFLLSTRFEWIDNGQPIGTITFGPSGTATATWNPAQTYAFDVNGDLLVSAEGTRWVTRLHFDAATATFRGTRDATSQVQDGVQSVMKPAASAAIPTVPAPTATQLAQLFADLSREDYARLYADLSVIFARYGNGAGWVDGQDPAAPPNDPGRGVTSWDAHYGHAISTGADLGSVLMARLAALETSLFVAQMIIDMEAEVSQTIARYGRPSVPGVSLEEAVDRPGMDYTSFDLDQADPALCQAACQEADQCRAFTYVAPGVQGAMARCWLKSDVPAAQPNTCCVSGVKGAGTIDTGVTVTQADGYLGCFKDPNAPFDLDGHLERSAQNTPQHCVDVCRAMGFAYAGVQYAESCLCGNRYGQFGPADNCNMACTGDGSQICGGANANSVYAVGADVPASGSIVVFSGTYGGICGQPEGNVTDHLAAACNGKASCDYKVDVGAIGDPASGCQKDYVAKWTCGGDVVQSSSAGPEAGYGSIVRLSCATN